MPNSKDAGVLQALNGPAFGGPAVERIGWVLTASGPALLVSLVGAPIVVAVNLDLADDEVAVGGPDAAGVRRLFQGVQAPDGGGVNNLLETLARRASTITPTQVAVAASPATTPILAANVNRLFAIVRNIEDVTGERVFVGDAGVTTANGTPLDRGTAAGRAGDSMTVVTTAEVRATGAGGAGLVSVLEFVL